MDIRYIPSVTNSAADTLSRYPYIQQLQIDSTLSDDLVEVCLITVAEVDSDIMNAIKAAYLDDTIFGPVLTNPERYPRYVVHNGLIYHNE